MFWKKKKSPNLQYFVIEPALRLMLKLTGFFLMSWVQCGREKGESRTMLGWSAHRMELLSLREAGKLEDKGKCCHLEMGHCQRPDSQAVSQGGSNGTFESETYCKKARLLGRWPWLGYWGAHLLFGMFWPLHSEQNCFATRSCHSAPCSKSTGSINES